MIKMMYIHVKSSIGSKVDPNYLPAVCELLEVKTTKTSLQLKNETQMYNYRTRAIITRGLYIFYPLFEGQKRFFKGLFS